jgi:hypothetical protein
MQEPELDVMIRALGVAMYFLIQLVNIVGVIQAGQIVSKELAKIGDQLAT